MTTTQVPTEDLRELLKLIEDRTNFNGFQAVDAALAAIAKLRPGGQLKDDMTRNSHGDEYEHPGGTKQSKALSMTELVFRLRNFRGYIAPSGGMLMKEAADALQAKVAEIERLRSGLLKLHNSHAVKWSGQTAIRELLGIKDEN